MIGSFYEVTALYIRPRTSINIFIQNLNLRPLPNQQKAFHGHEHDLMCPAALDIVVLQTLASCKFVTTSKRSPFLMNDNRPSEYSHQNTKFVL